MTWVGLCVWVVTDQSGNTWLTGQEGCSLLVKLLQNPWKLVQGGVESSGWSAANSKEGRVNVGSGRIRRG